MDYVVGYGSLVNSESRKITGLTAEAYPVWLQGFERSWSASFSDLTFCALSALPETQKKMNAVLFKVVDVNEFDEREMGYDRVEIANDSVVAYDPNMKLPTDSRFWIYIPKKNILGRPHEKNLIWQSYSDVCLAGALEHGETFTRDFIKSTIGWDEKFWADDRLTNDYLKVLKNYRPEKIDQILREFNLQPKMKNFDDSALRKHVQKRLT
ncbi:MAG: hypothetical protein ACXWQQ_08800 [Pseudobdellovibrio sp.]